MDTLPSRRSVLKGIGVPVSVSVVGCSDTRLGSDGQTPASERRSAVCSHVPESATEVAFESATLRGNVPLVVGGRFEDDSQDPVRADAHLELVADRSDIETSLRLESLDADERTQAVETFITDTDFDSEALLLWQTAVSSGGNKLETVGVTTPSEDTVHAYTCLYDQGGGNGTAVSYYTLLIRVAVPQRPTRATLTHRSGPDAGQDTTRFVAHPD